jgi:hypothetical protein
LVPQPGWNTVLGPSSGNGAGAWGSGRGGVGPGQNGRVSIRYLTSQLTG